MERVVIDAIAIPESIGIPTLRSLFRFDEAAAIRAAGIPLVCINSDKYPVNSDALEESAPSFQLKLMPGVSHYPMLEEPKTFNRLLAEAIGSLSQE